MEILYEALHSLYCAALTALLGRAAARRPGTALYAMTGAAACAVLGDAYWLAHLVVRGTTPTVFSACDVAYIGLWLMLSAAQSPFPVQQGRRALACAMGGFALLNTLGWIAWSGAWFNNLLWGLTMGLSAVRCAARIRLARGAWGVFLALLLLVTGCESAYFLLPAGCWPTLDLACTGLWLAALLQLAWALAGKLPLARLPLPGWTLLLLVSSFAGLLCEGWAYHLFQVLAAACLGGAAWAACREEGTKHAC